jgi:hypothetical protein
VIFSVIAGVLSVAGLFVFVGSSFGYLTSLVFNQKVLDKQRDV